MTTGTKAKCKSKSRSPPDSVSKHLNRCSGFIHPLPHRDELTLFHTLLALAKHNTPAHIGSDSKDDGITTIPFRDLIRRWAIRGYAAAQDSQRTAVVDGTRFSLPEEKYRELMLRCD